MTKKMFFPLVGILMLTFLFSFTLTTPILAQEEQKEEDIEDFSLEDLLNVEITTAGKQAEKVSEIPASIVLVTREDIETYGYQSLSEVLASIPGLYETDDLYSTKFGVRGRWSERDNGNVIIQVNGVPMRDDLYNSFPLELNAVPVEAIDRVDVVRGPMSVIYGSGAFFGVINIITNQVDENNAINQVSLSYGSENTMKLFLRSAGKQGDFSYVFNGSYFSTDGLSEPYSKMTDPSALPDFGAPVDHSTDGQLENETKYFNFSGVFKDFTFDLIYSENPQKQAFLLPPVDDGTNKLHKAFRLAFGYKKEFSDKLTVDARFMYFENRWRYEYDLLFPGFLGDEDDSTRGYNAELNFFWRPTPKLDITLGLNYNSVIDVLSLIDVPMFSLGDVKYSLADGESMITQSIFAQVNYKLSDRLKIVAGARIEQMPKYILQTAVGDPEAGSFTTSTASYDRTKADFIPRLAVIFSPNDKHYFKLLYGQALNRPSFFQNQDRLNNQAAAVLDPETIQTIELAYIANFSSKFTISLNLFRNMLDELIFRTQLLVDGEYSTFHANTGKTTTNGVELTIQGAPSRSFKFEISGTYQDTNDERAGFEDIEPGYSPKLLGYLKLSYFFNKDFSLALTGTYVDEMETYWDGDELTGGRIGEKVDGYFLLGANLRMRNLFGTKMFFNLRGSNLLNEEIHFPTTSNNDWASLGTLGRGLSFLATLGLRF